MGILISIHPFAYLLCLIVSARLSLCITTLEAGPENRTVFTGESTSLMCDFSDDNDKPIIWARVDPTGEQRFVSHDNMMYPHPGVNPSDYQVVVDDEKEVYELVFKNVKESPDGAMYQCGYWYEQTLQFIPLASAYLTVLPQEYSFTCQYLHLPPRPTGTDAAQEIEITCVFNREVELQVDLYLNGRRFAADLQFPDRVISRVKVNSDSTTIDAVCKAIFQENGSTIVATKSCLNSYNSNNRGVIRVDPFINEVPHGSDAVFKCIKGEQSAVHVKFWNIFNMTNMFFSGGRRIENRTEITIPDVQTEDEILLIECRASVRGNIWVSSFAALRVLPNTTVAPPSRGRTDNYSIMTTNVSGTVGVTRSSQSLGMNKRILIAIIVIFLIIVVIVAIVIFLIRRKINSQPLQSKSSVNNSISYGTNELQDIPHVTSNDNTQSYTLSFEDERTRLDKTVADSTSYQQKAQDCTAAANSDGFHSVNIVNGRGHLANESVEDLKEPIGMFRPLHILNDVNYKMMMQDDDLCEIPRTDSMTTMRSSPSGRRWTSQKMKRITLQTPPKGRRALSYKKPTANSDPNVSTEYAEMSIRRKTPDDTKADDANTQRSVPVYAKPDKSKKTNRYLVSSKCDVHLPASTIESLNPTNPDAGRSKKKELKGTSLHGPFPGASSQAPPKPKRGKCQSQFVTPTQFNVVNDYEIMAKQVQNNNQDAERSVDDQGQALNDHKPRRSVMQKPPRRDRPPSGLEPLKPTRRSSVVLHNDTQVQDEDSGSPNVSSIKSGDDANGLNSPDYAEIDDTIYESVDP